ncbi:MAG: LexA binding domain [Firmicutes bacterium]|nr:LexA binding domain [Bacillota bacterium]
MYPRKQAILDFIREYPRKYPPTAREIAAGMGLKSSATVHEHLNTLVKMRLSSAGLIALGV